MQAFGKNFPGPTKSKIRVGTERDTWPLKSGPKKPEKGPNSGVLGPFWAVLGVRGTFDVAPGSKNAKKRKMTLYYGLRGIGDHGSVPPVWAPEPHSSWQKSGYQGPVFDHFWGSNGGRVHAADILYNNKQCHQCREPHIAICSPTDRWPERGCGVHRWGMGSAITPQVMDRGRWRAWF